MTGGSRGGFVRGLSDAFSQYLTVSDQMQQRRAEQERQRKMDEEAAKRAQVAEFLQRKQLALSEQANDRANAGFEAEQFGRGFTKLAPDRAQGLADLAPMANAPTAPGGMAQAGSGLGAMADFLGKVGNQSKNATGGWAKTNYSTGERKEANDLYDAEQQRKARAAEQEANRTAENDRLDKTLRNARQIAGMRIDAAGSQPPAQAKTLPMGEVDKLSSQGAAVAQLDDVERILANPGKANTGIYPNIFGQRAANLINKEGTELRAAIANISSLTYLDRSGAAVTPSEDARLAPLVPKDTDDPQVALVKLRKLRDHIKREQATVSDYYEQQGYAVPKMPGRSGTQPMTRDESTAAARFRAQAKAEGYSDDEVDAELKRRGIK